MIFEAPAPHRAGRRRGSLEPSRPGLHSSGYFAGSYDCRVVVPGCSRIHVRRPPRSGAARVLVRTVLRGSRGRRSRLLARVGRVPARRPTRRGRRWRSRTCSSAMAPHVSRFVDAAVRRRAPAPTRSRAATRDQDDLFRFKVDFVRRRALPLLKGGAHVAVDAGRRRDRRAADRGRRSTRRSRAARSRAPAARCSIARRAGASARAHSRQPETRGAEALVRRAPARSARIAAGWSSGFPRTLDYWHLVEVAASRAAAARSDDRPRRRLRRRDGFKLTDARMHAARGAERDPLLRALPRARQGLAARKGIRDKDGHGHRRTRSASRWPAARSTRRSPRCTLLRKARRRDRRAGARHRRQPDVPGHRPPHLQRLHEGLHLPEAGAGQHPADRDRRADRRARACRGASRSTAC